MNDISLVNSSRPVVVADGSAALDAELSGVISHAGGTLVKSGSGTLALTGTNTYGSESGGTEVLDGVPIVDGDSLSDDSKLVIDGAKVQSTGTEDGIIFHHPVFATAHYPMKTASQLLLVAVLGIASLHPQLIAKETTPLTLPGSEPHVFRKVGDVELRLHVVKPEGWTKDRALPCLVSFFGGGWISGTPERSIFWAKWAASHGMVGIAPDYRTRDRFGTQPEDCVADGRAAITWIAAHAAELGINPKKIIAVGGSAGGHVAAWTAIPAAGPGKEDPAPKVLPAALVLVNPVTDTKDGVYGALKRFKKEARARACSVPDQMPTKMPPTIVFHGTADVTVPYANSVAFRDKMISNGNRCELVSFEGLGHSYSSSKYGAAGKAANDRTKQETEKFLTSLGLIEKAAPGS